VSNLRRFEKKKDKQLSLYLVFQLVQREVILMVYNWF